MINRLKHYSLLALLLALIVHTPPSMAEELRMGIKVGGFDLDFKQFEQEENFLATAVQIGYEFASTKSMAFSAEAEFTSSLTEGKVGTEDFSYKSIGILGAVRTQGNIYLIGRLGVVEAEADFESRATIEDDATIFGAGIGFGKDDVRREITLDSISYEDKHSALYLAFGLAF